jgi:hypothetical protein
MRAAPIKAIQDLAGHMHLSPAALDSAIRLLDQPPAAKVFDILETPTAAEGEANE